MQKLKENLMVLCKATLREKISNLDRDLQEISDSMTNETKSSVGDKHETARARMQSEYEKVSVMRSELVEQKMILEKIDMSKSSGKVTAESLVMTDQENFFLSIPMGKLTVGGQIVYGISARSPIGQKLIGLKAGDRFFFNGRTYNILSTY